MPGKGGDRSNQCWEGPGTYMGILGTYLQEQMNQGPSLENGEHGLHLIVSYHCTMEKWKLYCSVFLCQLYCRYNILMNLGS